MNTRLPDLVELSVIPCRAHLLRLSGVHLIVKASCILTLFYGMVSSMHMYTHHVKQPICVQTV